MKNKLYEETVVMFRMDIVRGGADRAFERLCELRGAHFRNG
jgi:hypothetical protein